MWSKTVKRLLEDSRGFTLVEVLVAVGLLIIVAGLVSSSTFQILSVQRTWQDDVLATPGAAPSRGLVRPGFPHSRDDDDPPPRSVDHHGPA